MVKIPAGVETGNKLRIPKAGDAGEKGGGPGDLYIFISVKDNPLFERDGADLHYKALITFVQASLGAELEVPTIDGRSALKFPAGTQPNTVFKMREKGMPHLNSRSSGDQYVHIEVETPTNLTRDQMDLLKKFGKMRGEIKEL